MGDHLQGQAGHQSAEVFTLRPRRDCNSVVFACTEQLFSLSEDRTVKLWQLPDLKPIGLVTNTRDVPTGIAKLKGTASQIMVADYSGTVAAVTPPRLKQAPSQSSPSNAAVAVNARPADTHEPAPQSATAEVEPNNSLQSAQLVKLPARISGAIASDKDGQTVVDLIAIDARQGQPWVIEVQAARNKSPLDSQIDVLDADGQAVLRTRLQAVRESYFTFRGKDSMTSDDYRLHKWQEMELNEMLYAGGEVVKLWLYPRGPILDSKYIRVMAAELLTLIPRLPHTRSARSTTSCAS